MTADARIVYATLRSPLGGLLLVGEQRGGGLTLTALSMSSPHGVSVVGPSWRHAPDLFMQVADQLPGYFAGEITKFGIEFTPGGTEFQRRVWRALEHIAFGATTSYGALAEQLDLPRERVQALGAAVVANPLLLVRPCHRVIGANGTMRGYAGGVDRKIKLLTHEGVLRPGLLEPIPSIPA